MLFADRIKELREKKQMVQRQFAVVLETELAQKAFKGALEKANNNFKL